ncbi:MAG: zinc-dependent peptidase [Gemmataceae bacterium]
MLFAWFKQRRRRRITAAPFPPVWEGYLHKNVALYEYLTEAEQAKLRDDLRIFMAEKTWEGCGGQPINDEVKVTISAQACLLVLGLTHDYFQRVQSILVYPYGYRPERDTPGPDGLIHMDGAGNLGESWYRGPVILSWADVLADGQHPGGGRNLVFHEFAHQLDMLDGLIDGTPPLETPEQYDRWRQVMTSEYQKLIEASLHGRATLLDQYGTTNEGEFFAVATECFFDKPVQMQRRHPQLYDILRDYYHQDPAARVAARHHTAHQHHPKHNGK